MIDDYNDWGPEGYGNAYPYPKGKRARNKKPRSVFYGGKSKSRRTLERALVKGGFIK